MARGNILSFLPSMNGNRATEIVADASDEVALFRNFEGSGTGWFWATDEQGMLTYVSQPIADHFGRKSSELIGSPLADLFAPATADSATRDRLPFVLSTESTFEKLALQAAGPGMRKWWELTGQPRYDSAQKFKGYLGFGIDVTEQLKFSKSASQLAMYDTLTGLPNRLSMSRALERHTTGLDRPGRSCGVMLIDLDRFKQVNDSLGHPAGDDLLKQVADRLLIIINDKERVFRLGGDEFQIIFPNCSDRDELSQIAHDIIYSLSQPYAIENSRCDIGASLGLAIGPEDGLTSSDLMRNVDLALYAAKDNGRGCYRFFSKALLQVAEDRRNLEEDLRAALSKGLLDLFYQPIVSSKDNRVTGVEALIRWTHPTRGPISPALFIPIAEEANLIDKLGEWIMRKACEDAASWPVDIRVAVNVSPLQFANENLPSIVMSALANSGIEPNRLEIELTEGVFLSESSETDQMFTKLKSIGVRLALDDFGTGYSSLGYLKTAPFDKIKIDQSFVRDATAPGSRNGAIIAAIVALAGALDMETTAEGIETFDQLDLIHKLGVSHVQGYIYSKAIPSDDLVAHLSAGTWAITPDGPAKHRGDRRSMYRKAGVILGSHYHSVLIRNLSDSGAYIEGLIDVPIGTEIILDFGDCQLAVATVRRAQQRGHGIEFVQPLVSDGADGLCTVQRVDPYTLAKQGLSSSSHVGGSRMLSAAGANTVEALSKVLGLKLPPAATLSSALLTGHGGGYLGGAASSSDHASHKVQQIFAAANPLQNMSLLNPGASGTRHLTVDEWERLKKTVEESHNPQLKYLIALVVLTGVRFPDLLTALWTDVDLDARVWTLQSTETGKSREIRLPEAAMDILALLPRATGCGHVIVNPRTKKPFNSVFGSWDAARKKAGLDSLSVHDLRNSIQRTWQF